MVSPPRYTLIIRPEAEEDLRAIAAYIAASSPDAAHRFIDRIVEAMDELVYMPACFPVARESGQVLADLRKCVEGPYRIIFEVRSREVVVIGIRHAARRPMDL